MTFDSGALIAIERGDHAIRALLRDLAADGVPILIPAAVVSEVWRGGTGRQARLAWFLDEGIKRGRVRVVSLDYNTARQVGSLLARARMSISDATVCHCALIARGAVVTSDPRDLERLIPRPRIHVV